MEENNSKTDIKTKENKKPDIKIFVSHRIDLDAETIDNPLYVNVRCGAVFDKRENVDMLGDDTGDNISEKRESFNELTVQYWAWKNVEADYYGLCHYRRYLSFSNKYFKTDVYANVVDNYITNESIEKYELINYSNIEKLLQTYNILITEPYIVSKAGFKNVKEQWNAVRYFKADYVDMLFETIDELYPEYLVFAKKYFHSNKFIPCNMCIMNKDMFNEYNTFLFNILFALENKIDTVDLSSEGIRVLGHIGERILGIFLMYKQDKNKLKIGHLQRVIFLNSEKEKPIKPISNNSIPIVLASNNYYVPYLYTAIMSFLNYKNEDDIYDIVILNSDITKKNKMLLKYMEKNGKNIYIRFVNMGALIAKNKFKQNDELSHISLDTFYRLFIPKIFKDFDRVIYLDSDLIIKKNIAEILKESSLSHTISATRDIDFVSQYYGMKKVRSYSDSVIRLKQIENYFQAGVFVFNIKMFKEKYSLDELLNLAISRKFLYQDQDIMNIFFKNDIFYLNLQWNVMTDCAEIRMNRIRLLAPYKLYKEYLEARKNPYIIHYAGFAKPWNRPEDDFGNDFWEVARNSPVYEIMLKRLSIDVTNEMIVNNNYVLMNNKLKNKILNKIRSVFIRTIPKNTILYKFFRMIYRKVRGN